jgi:hypothetical protein
MKIKVFRAYKGNRAKKEIKEGAYNEGDPRIYGLARYLIDNGNAIEIAKDTEEKPARKPRSDKGKARTRTREVGK